MEALGTAMTHEVSRAEYWNALYLAKDTGWDKGRCAPPIERLLAEGHVPSGGHVAVVGCGKGHEAVAAARAGFTVTAIDFAPEAIAAVRANSQDAGVVVGPELLDLFALPFRFPSAFDAIIEHTCLCAIDPTRRSEYVDAVAAALKPSGLLLGLLYAHNKPAGPPFTITEAEARSNFERRFAFTRLRTAPDSFEHRQGFELEFIARRSEFDPQPSR
jgi:SAM-dependent methyltransferase